MLVEFQARPDRKMARRLLEYTAMHHRRHVKPVYPVVINLTGGGRQDERHIFECIDLTVVNFNYRMINLEDVAGRELLYRGSGGLLLLAPLMRQEEPPEAVLEKCAERIGPTKIRLEDLTGPGGRNSSTKNSAKTTAGACNTGPITNSENLSNTRRP